MSYKPSYADTSSQCSQAAPNAKPLLKLPVRSQHPAGNLVTKRLRGKDIEIR